MAITLNSAPDHAANRQALTLQGGTPTRCKVAPISTRPIKTRWLGLVSLDRLVSGTILTFLARIERMTIAPVKCMRPPQFGYLLKSS